MSLTPFTSFDTMEEDAFTSKYLGKLNTNQLTAVKTIEGPILLLAVPGSGKTTVLVNRLGYMIFCKQINPKNILTLTYTVAATQDMSKRFAKVFGEEYSDIVEFRTINGICAKIIAYYGKIVGKSAFELVTDEKITGKIVSDILVKKMSEYPTESDVKAAKTLITYCKNMLLDEDEIEELGEDEGIPLLDIYKEYNSILRTNHQMDYDDQMVYAYKMLKNTPDLLSYYQNIYRYICVDEAQDTSKVQHMIINLLAGKSGNLFMVGDEDQSIYGFRAAYPEALLNFESTYQNAKVLVMDQNYRSNAKIVAGADIFIQHNKARHEKHMQATKPDNSDINLISLNSRSNQYSYLLKVATNCDKETAVLYRDNECVLPLVDLLDRSSIPYRIKNVDMSFFTNRVFTDVTNILKFAIDPYNADIFMKIYFKCQTYLKKSQAEQLCRISAFNGTPILDAIEEVSELNEKVKGKCRAFRTNLKSMLSEAPSKALFRIGTTLGYEEYLSKNNIDENKLFILKMLSYQEDSVFSFLSRLDYLQELLKTMQPNFDCKFILSTIHSSKGLEYEQVYIMDACDGILPSKAPNKSSLNSDDLKLLEEERRLFYVAMTRAKKDLHIFRFKDSSASFIKELLVTPKKAKEKSSESGSQKKNSNSLHNEPLSQYSVQGQHKYTNNTKEAFKHFDLIIGQRVVQIKYGYGTITDATYNANGVATKFTVTFESGEIKSFLFPVAFMNGMKLIEES